MRPSALRSAAALTAALLTAALLTLAACDKAANPLAPGGSTLTVTAVPSQIPISGEGARITVIGIKPDGNPVNPGTQFTLTTNLGVLRPEGVPCSDPAVVDVIEAGDQGRAGAQLCGDGRTGDAEVTATLTNVGGGGGGGDAGGGGGSSATVTVTIGETDASKPTVIVSANPSVVPVGGDSTITLIGRSADNTPVPSGSRIRLTADLGTLRCPRFPCPGESTDPCNAACTDALGEAEATFRAGDRSGQAEVTAILGTSDPAMAMVTINATIESLDLVATPPTIRRVDPPGEEVTLTATLTDPLGTPLQSVLVRFPADVGSLSAANANSNAQGVAMVTLTVTSSDLTGIDPGESFNVTASATSEGETRSDTVSITVQD